MPINPDNRSDKIIKKKDEAGFTQVYESSRFSEAYKELCFRAWYDNDKPRGKKLQEILPEDEHGRKVKNTTLMGWRRGERGWNVRAKAMDTEIQEQVDNLFIMRRVEMFERHAEAGAQMVDMGLDYLEEFEIASASVAIKAIKEGTDLERESLGIDELLKSLSSMSDKQLVSLAEKLEEETEEEEIVEGVTVNVVDIDDTGE